MATNRRQLCLFCLEQIASADGMDCLAMPHFGLALAARHWDAAIGTVSGEPEMLFVDLIKLARRP